MAVGPMEAKAWWLYNKRLLSTNGLNPTTSNWYYWCAAHSNEELHRWLLELSLSFSRIFVRLTGTAKKKKPKIWLIYWFFSDLPNICHTDITLLFHEKENNTAYNLPISQAWTSRENSNSRGEGVKKEKKSMYISEIGKVKRKTGVSKCLGTLATPNKR